MESIVKVQDLKKYFGNIKAVDGISFEVKKGEIFGLIGPDGAGKTTTLRILTGLLNINSGEVQVAGFYLPQDSEKVKENIGYMPQKFSLYNDLTVKENISFFAEIFEIDKKILMERMEPLLEMTRLHPFSDRLTGNLSGGMKQKLALMCTLIHRPKILILDEPTIGVDPVSRREFWEILQNIVAEGITVILSTPYMDEAEWCTHIGLIFKGKILQIDTPKNLKKQFPFNVFEIELKNNREKVIEKINNIKEIVDAKILGKKIRVITKIDEIVFNLKKDFYDAIELKKVEPVIEDIFITKIKTGH